jgi:hypothetical protein
MTKYTFTFLLIIFFTFTGCTENFEEENESITIDSEINEEETDSDDVDSSNDDSDTMNDDVSEEEDLDESADYVFTKGYYEDYGTGYTYDGNLIILTVFSDGLDYQVGGSNLLQVEADEYKGSGTYSVIDIYSPIPGELPTGDYIYDPEHEMWTFQNGWLCQDCTTFDDSGISSNFEGGLIKITKSESNYTINLLFNLTNGETISGYYSGPLIDAKSLFED